MHRRETTFVHYLYGMEVPKSLGAQRHWTLVEDSSGLLWIGTEGGGLYQFDRSSGLLVRHTPDPEDPGSIADEEVSAICEDGAGRLWIASGPAFDRFDRENQRFIHYGVSNAGEVNAPGPLMGVDALYADKQGFLWLGISRPTVGLLKFDTEQEEIVGYMQDPDPPKNPRKVRIRSIFEASDDVFWLGTSNDGLRSFDPKRARWISYKNEPENPRSLSSNIVWSVVEDSVGKLWIATSSGLNLFDKTTEKFTRFTQEDGLPSNLIYSILSEGESLWIATSNGMARLDLQMEKFRIYGENDGLYAGSFSRSAGFKGREGEMFFASGRGIVAFHPGDVQQNLRVPPPVVLTDFRKFNKKIDLGRPISEVSEIELSYQDNFISFEFAALDYHDPEKNRYAYQLEGFDQSWIESGTGRTATYTNLDPRTYVLRVKGASHDGAWNQAGLSIQLSIKPPFWITWWFRGTCLVVFSSLLLVGYRIRIRGIRKRNVLLKELVEERTAELRQSQAALLRQERLATLGQLTATVSHELRNPLGTMQVGLCSIRKRMDGADRRLEQTFLRVERGLTRCDHIIDELLDFTRTTRAERRSVVVDSWLGELLDEESVPEGLTVRRELGLPGLTVLVDAYRLRRAVVNVYENACQAMASENAPQRAREGSILTVSTRRSGECLEIEVADTGPGIPEHVLPRIFEPLYSTKMFGVGLGLPTVQRILEDHGGDLEIETAEGQGTRVVFRLLPGEGEKGNTS